MIYDFNDGFNDRIRSLHDRQMPDRVGQDHALGQAPYLRVYRNAVAALGVQLLTAGEHDVLGENGIARQPVTLDAHDATVDGYGDDGDHVQC